MARIYGIKKRLELNKVDKKIIKEIIGNNDLVDIVVRMEKLIAPHMMHEIFDSCGCGGGRDYIKHCEKIGKELTGKPLEEKIKLINSDSEQIVLNNDNTLTIVLHYNNGNNYKCVCSAAIKTGIIVSDLAQGAGADGRIMPLTYCFCCAGSYRRHLQLKLGLDLKTKEILSSPINSKGEKPCKFVLEIIR